ncbi:MAG: PDGLE domain-containing protein [Dehalococcoidia bacterium]
MKNKWWITGYFIAIAVALLSPLASGSPDGMERVAEDKGFIETALDPGYEIIPDYTFPGVENEAVATMLAGVVGVTLMFGLMYGVSFLLLRTARRRNDGGLSMSRGGTGAG